MCVTSIPDLIRELIHHRLVRFEQTIIQPSVQSYSLLSPLRCSGNKPTCSTVRQHRRLVHFSANVLLVILGGAGLGAGVGLVSHWVKAISGDQPAQIPEAETQTPQ